MTELATTATRQTTQGPSATAGGPRRRRRGPRLDRLLGPLVVLVVFVTTWQAGIWNELFGIGTFALPPPAEIAEAFRDSRALLAGSFVATFYPALLGYALGNALGLGVGMLLVALPAGVARRVSGVFAGVQALPIIATAPLVALWVGTGTTFKAVTVMIMTFPSMMIYAYRGMTGVQPAALDLMRSYDATPGQVFRQLRLPGALPHVFTALRYATVLALVGVIVCEVMRARSGLGYVMIDGLQAFRTAEAWAAVVLLSAGGIVWYSLLGLLERVLFPWSAGREPGSAR